MAANNSFQKAMKAFDHPFPKILFAVGNLLHVASSNLSENDESQSHHPGDDHRICDKPLFPDLCGLLRNTVLFVLSLMLGGVLNSSGSLRRRSSMLGGKAHRR